MTALIPTFVNLATLPWVDVVAQEIHERMQELLHKAAKNIAKWYEEHHYHPVVEKASSPHQASIDAALDSLKWDDVLAPLYDYMAKMYQAGTDVPSTGQYRPMGLNFTHPDPTAVSYAQRRSAELVGKRVQEDGSIVENPNQEWAITPQLREDIRQAVQTALEGEPSPDELRRDIQHLTGFQYPRARMIARTELAFAYNSGHHDQAYRMGYTLKSSILGSLHKQPDECDENAAAAWIPMEQLFPSGDEMPPYHPNCVCDLLYKRHEGENAEDWGTNTKMTSDQVMEELQKTGESYTPSTPGDIQKPEAVSHFLPLKEVFDDAAKGERHFEGLPASSFDGYWNKAHEVRDKYAPTWTEDQRKVMHAYTHHGDERMNGALRGTKRMTPKVTKEIQDLTHDIDSYRMDKNVLTYRGVGADVGPETLKAFKEYIDQPDKLVNDPLLIGDKAFTSTTAKPFIADSFLVKEVQPGSNEFRVLVRTAIPKDAPALPLGAYSRFEQEEEVLLKPGSVQRVVGVRAQPEIYVIKTRGVHTVRTIFLNENPLEEFNRKALKKITVKEALTLLRDRSAVARYFPGKLEEGETHSKDIAEGKYVVRGARKIIVDAVYLPNVTLDGVSASEGTALSDLRKMRKVAYAGEPGEGSIAERWEQDELLLVRRAR